MTAKRFCLCVPKNATHSIIQEWRLIWRLIWWWSNQYYDDQKWCKKFWISQISCFWNVMLMKKLFTSIFQIYRTQEFAFRVKELFEKVYSKKFGWQNVQSEGGTYRFGEEYGQYIYNELNIIMYIICTCTHIYIYIYRYTCTVVGTWSFFVVVFFVLLVTFFVLFSPIFFLVVVLLLFALYSQNSFSDQLFVRIDRSHLSIDRSVSHVTVRVAKLKKLTGIVAITRIV